MPHISYRPVCVWEQVRRSVTSESCIEKTAAIWIDLVFGVQANIHLSYTIFWGNCGDSKYKYIFLWNIIPNFELGKLGYSVFDIAECDKQAIVIGLLSTSLVNGRCGPLPSTVGWKQLPVDDTQRPALWTPWWAWSNMLHRLVLVWHQTSYHQYIQWARL